VDMDQVTEFDPESVFLYFDIRWIYSFVFVVLGWDELV
jgi:hypothetical protein